MQPGYYPPPPPYTGFDPSSSQLPRSSPTQPAEEDMPQAEHRQLIEQEGSTFYPSKPPVHKIRDIIRSKYDAPYVSWKKIPLAVRDLWFKEFEKSFYWNPHHHDSIRGNFESRGSARLQDMFTDIRKEGERPLWIGEEVWAGLCAEWRKPEYLKYSEQNKKIVLLTAVGWDPLYIQEALFLILSIGGGCILGREPTPVELHQRTHQRKSDPRWVDQRSQKVFDVCTRIQEAHRHSSIGESSSGSSQCSDMDLWQETVGGQKKGRIYGLGSQGKAYASSSSPYSGHTSDYIEEMVQQKYASFAEQMRTEMRAEMRAEMKAEIDARLEAAFSSRLGKEPIVEEEEEEEEDDDDDEEDADS